MKKIIFLMCVLTVVGGCGKKGPPIPWETVVPKRIVDLEASPREERLLLRWSSPKENTDKSPLTDLAEVRVLRSEGILVGGGCKGCGEKAKVVYEMKVDRKEDMRGKKFSLLFEDQEARKVYVYQVVSINGRGYPGAPSNPVTVYWDYSLQPPGRMDAERGDKRVDLSWQPVEGATGYNVYRRSENEEFPMNPLNREPLTLTRYTDLSIQNETKYFYSIRSVRRVVKTDVEGKGSLETPITPTDLIPPSAPTGLAAIAIKTGIELNWRRNPEPDLFGYNIYRRRPEEKDFKKLNETPLGKEFYLDTQVELEQDYEYAVTAVDNSPHKNEGPLSEEVRIKYEY